MLKPGELPEFAIHSSQHNNINHTPTAAHMHQATEQNMHPNLPEQYQTCLPAYKSNQGGEGVEHSTEGEPDVEVTAACVECGEDTDPGNALVCEGCKQVLHTYCMDDAMPEGLIPSDDYYCPTCRPFEVEGAETTQATPSEYLDIWLRYGWTKKRLTFWYTRSAHRQAGQQVMCGITYYNNSEARPRMD